MATPAKIGKEKHLALAEDAQAAIQAAKNLAIQASTLVSDLRIAGIMVDLAEHLETANSNLSQILLLIQAGDVMALEKLTLQLNDRNQQLTDIITGFASQIRRLEQESSELKQEVSELRGQNRPQWVVAPENKP